MEIKRKSGIKYFEREKRARGGERHFNEVISFL